MQPTLISITPDLYESLRLLLHAPGIRLPEELGRAIAEHVKLYDTAEDAAPSSEENVPDEDEPTLLDPEQTAVNGQPTHIPHPTLLEISAFIRLPAQKHALRHAKIDPGRYTMVSLCAGTRTYITPAQERLIRADPGAASAFLPPTFTPSSSGTTNSTTSDSGKGGIGIGAEYRAVSKELSAVFNILFSVGGVGAAVYVVANTSAGMNSESAVLLAFLAAGVTALAETWLYVVYSRRSAERAREGEEIRLVEMRQAGLSPAVLGDVEVGTELAVGTEGDDTSRETEKLETVAENENTGTDKESTLLPAHGESNTRGTNTIRLRRRPLAPVST